MFVVVFNKKPGINLNIIFNVAIVLMLINVTEIKAEYSKGFRGKVVERIEKSRHKIVHSIGFRVTDQSEVCLLST